MMEQPDHLSSLSPAELRLLIRQEDSRISTTSGLAYGKKQFFFFYTETPFGVFCVILTTSTVDSRVADR